MFTLFLSAFLSDPSMVSDWEKLMPGRTPPSDFEFSPSSIHIASSGKTVWARMKLIEYRSGQFVQVGSRQWQSAIDCNRQKIAELRTIDFDLRGRTTTDRTIERPVFETIAAGTISDLLAKATCNH